MYPQLINYIKQAKSQGLNDEQIKKNLLSSGWTEEDIKNAWGMMPVSSPASFSLNPNPVLNINSNNSSFSNPISNQIPTSINPSASYNSMISARMTSPKIKTTHTFLKIFIVLIIFVLFGGGYYVYLNKNSLQDILNKFIPVPSNNLNNTATNSNPNVNPINPVNQPIQKKDILPTVNLELSVVQVSDKQNAFFDLNSITNDEIKDTLTQEDQINYIQDKNFDLNIATKFINKHKIAITKFEKATQKIYFQDPMYSDPKLITPSTLLPNLSSWKDATFIYLIKAITLAKQGQVDDALILAFDSLKLAHNIEQSQGSLVTYLDGMDMKNKSFQTIQTIMPLIKSPQTLKTFGSLLDQYKDNKDGLELALKDEYYTQLNRLESLIQLTSAKASDIKKFTDTAKGTSLEETFTYFSNNPQSLNEQETKQYFTDYYSKEIQMIDQDCANLQSVPVANLLPIDKTTYSSTENITGKLLASVFTVDISPVFQKRCEQDALFNSIKTLFTQSKNV